MMESMPLSGFKSVTVSEEVYTPIILDFTPVKTMKYRYLIVTLVTTTKP